MGRGQYSLDFMITLAGFMAFFLVMYSVTIHTASRIDNSLAVRDSLLSAKIMSDNINSLCIMSSGSTIHLKLYFPVNTSLIYSNYKINVSGRTFDVRCPVKISKEHVYGTYAVTLVNSNGVVLAKFGPL